MEGCEGVTPSLKLSSKGPLSEVGLVSFYTLGQKDFTNNVKRFLSGGGRNRGRISPTLFLFNNLVFRLTGRARFSSFGPRSRAGSAHLVESK